MVQITGGHVTAKGGLFGAGIGGGALGAGGSVTVSGGTVRAIAGPGMSVAYSSAPSGMDVGGGTYGRAGEVAITGGSLSASTFFAEPSNGVERVYCVTVPGLPPDAEVSVSGLGGYGVADIRADESGNAYLWLPSAEKVHGFTAGGFSYSAMVAGADAVAEKGTVVGGFSLSGLSWTSLDMEEGTLAFAATLEGEGPDVLTLVYRTALGSSAQKAPGCDVEWSAGGGALTLPAGWDDGVGFFAIGLEW